jgi:hypothetical protein
MLSYREEGCPGGDVTITIFCEKIGVFLKKQNNVMIPFSQNSAVFLSQKRQILAKIFGENIFKS